VAEGIGTGLILNHQLVKGSTGMAGEFGHTTVVPDGLECRCGNRGCWEVYASNLAAVRYYVESSGSVRPGKNKLSLSGNVPTFDDLLRLTEQGDPKARAALSRMAGNAVPVTDPHEPFAIVAVELDAEKMVVLGQVVAGVPVADLRIGMPVELVVDVLFGDDEGDRTVWKWRPNTTPATTEGTAAAEGPVQ